MQSKRRQIHIRYRSRSIKSRKNVTYLDAVFSKDTTRIVVFIQVL